jgi:hypothetical protein
MKQIPTNGIHQKNFLNTQKAIKYKSKMMIVKKPNLSIAANPSN